MELHVSNDQEIISKLQSDLYNEAEILHHVEQSIQDDLANNDLEAQALLDTAVQHAMHSFREIGYELNAYGGFELMQSSIYTISNAGFGIVPIEHAWNGIGDWIA